MYKLANYLAGYITSELGLDNDRKEVIAYGTFAIVQTVYSIVLVIIFGFIFQVVLEALIVSFTGSILRKYSGGVHASTPSACTALGTIVCVGQGLLIKYIIGSNISINMLLLLCLATFTWSFIEIYRLAPVDSPAKPITTIEKKKRMKKGSILILIIYLLILATSIYLYLCGRNKETLMYSLSLCGGILWQTFTLTSFGNKVFRNIDAFFNFINVIHKEAR